VPYEEFAADDMVEPEGKFLVEIDPPRYGEAKDPHPFFFAETLRSPLPQGERARDAAPRGQSAG
jgi:hypothetical protein